MARLHGKDSRVLLNEVSVSAQLQGWTFTHNRAYAQTAALGDDGDHWVPGQINGAVSLKGQADGVSDGLRSEAIAAAGVDDSVLVTVFPAAFTIGTPALIAVSDLSSFMTDVTIRDAVTAVIEGQPSDGVDMGYTLHGLTAETADVNSASVDNGASSANGLVATLHVTTYVTLTSAVVKVQHSTDNSAWSDLITFTTATAITSERKTVTGTVNRYLRSFLDVTGSGSVTFALAAARR